MKKIIAAVLLASGASLVIFAGYKMVEFLAVDKCLDNGGRWNYEEWECEK